MADSELPFTAFRFRVRFDGDTFGGFSECTGLSLEFQTQDYEEGGRNGETLRFPTRGRQTNIVLKHGIVNRRLWDWYFKLLRGERDFRKSGSIEVLDAAGDKTEITLEVSNAFPCKWIGPDLNAMQSNVAVESLELCHEGLNWV